MDIRGNHAQRSPTRQRALWYDTTFQVCKVKCIGLWLEFYILAFAPQRIHKRITSMIEEEYLRGGNPRASRVLSERIKTEIWPDRFRFVLVTHLLCRALDKINTRIPTLVVTSVFRGFGLSKTGMKLLATSGLSLPYSSYRKEVRNQLLTLREDRRFTISHFPMTLRFLISLYILDL